MKLCKQEKWQEAMVLQRQLWQLNQAFAKYKLAACVKGGLTLQGYAVGEPLKPQDPLSAEGFAAVEQVLKSVGAL